jgi:hypothetical protein
MSKRIISIIGLVALMVLISGVLSAAAPLPKTTFTLLQGLPSTMSIGETGTVIVHVDSDQEFISIQALPSFQFPGKGVIAVQGGDRAGRGASATLEITFKAKGSTAAMPGGVAPVYVVLGVRYGGGYVAVQQYIFNVAVP